MKERMDGAFIFSNLLSIIVGIILMAIGFFGMKRSGEPNDFIDMMLVSMFFTGAPFVASGVIGFVLPASMYNEWFGFLCYNGICR